MPRPSKKADDKAKVPVVPAPTMVHPPVGMMPVPPVPVGLAAGVPTRLVDPDSFLRVRDSVSGLAFPYRSLSLFKYVHGVRMAAIAMLSTELAWQHAPLLERICRRHAWLRCRLTELETALSLVQQVSSCYGGRLMLT